MKATQAARHVLMSRDNPTGWKLEELLEQIQFELLQKSITIGGDKRLVARRVLRNDQQIRGLLEQAEALHRDSLDHLESLGPDPGPDGDPRIGRGSIGDPIPEPPPDENGDEDNG